MHYGNDWPILGLPMRKMSESFAQLSTKSPEGQVRRDGDGDVTFLCATSWNLGKDVQA